MNGLPKRNGDPTATIKAIHWRDPGTKCGDALENRLALMSDELIEEPTIAHTSRQPGFWFKR